jgi:lipopolysaccharide export system protein LptA
MPLSFQLSLRGLPQALAPVLGGGALMALALLSGGGIQGGAIATAQTPAAPGQALKLESDVQEANSKTGVITARGNVRINYPARQIQATAAQALYYSREKRIILSGNVYVLQQGNSLRGETITYLIDEGRFIALPQPKKQVEAIYLVPDAPPAPTTPVATPFSPQLEFPAGAPDPTKLIP